MAEQLKMIRVPVEALRRNHWNPNVMGERTFTAERQSIRRFGFIDPVLVRVHPDIEGAYEIIDGEHRWKAAVEEGLSEVLITPIVASDSEARRLTVIFNETRGNADYRKLGTLLASLNDGGDDALDLGLPYDERDMARLLEVGSYPWPDADAVAATAEPDETPPPAPPKRPKSKRGQVYELGQHRVMCGDATNPDDVATLLDGAHPPLLVTSPPYLDARDYESGGDDLDVDKLASFIAAFAPHVELQVVNLGILRRNNEIIPYWNSYLNAASEAGLKLLAWNVWDRGRAWSVAQQTAMFPLEHEWLFVFGERRVPLKRTVPNKNKTGVRPTANRQRDGRVVKTPPKIIRDARPIGSVFHKSPVIGFTAPEHPATFPVALPLAFIEAVTNPGEAVVDPFAGSGTTLIAAEHAGRRCYAMEIAPAYVDVIRQRYADFTDQEQLEP